MSSGPPCFICKNIASIESVTGRVAHRVRCSLCGEYIVSHPLSLWLSKTQSHELFPFLTAHIRQATEAGSVVELTQDNWEILARGHMNTPVVVKLRKMLEYLARNSKRPGDRIEVMASAVYPLFDASDSRELTYLLETLVERGDVVHDGSRWMIRAAGWERLDPSGGGVAGTCFIAMSFDPSLDSAYADGIFAAVETDCGFIADRVDQKRHNDNITDRIRAGIRRAQLVVADFTLQRPGVYYEAGLAEGLGRIVIRSCRADDFANLHFDTRQIFHLKWETPADLRLKLRDHILATVTPLPPGAFTRKP